VDACQGAKTHVPIVFGIHRKHRFCNDYRRRFRCFPYLQKFCYPPDRQHWPRTSVFFFFGSPVESRCAGPPLTSTRFLLRSHAALRYSHRRRSVLPLGMARHRLDLPAAHALSGKPRHVGFVPMHLRRTRPSFTLLVFAALEGCPHSAAGPWLLE